MRGFLYIRVIKHRCKHSMKTDITCETTYETVGEAVRHRLLDVVLRDYKLCVAVGFFHTFVADTFEFFIFFMFFGGSHI